MTLTGLRKRTRAAAALLMLAVVTSTAPAEDHQVLCEGVLFIPADITVAPGDTITWVWVDTFHTVTSGANCVFDNGFFNATLHPGNPTFTWEVPNQTGVLDYFCAPHCTLGMVGTITIEDDDEPCVGDTNNDGAVNVSDLLGLLAAWETSDPLYDLEVDGVINVQDLLLLLANWATAPDQAPGSVHSSTAAVRSP